MPNWEGIEDASSSPTTIWLSREKDNEPWMPLRKVDCRALNDSHGQSVRIEGGRATADPETSKISYNFYNSPSRQLISATWFIKEEKSSKECILHPLSLDDAKNVEALYQKAVAATSSLGEGIDQVLKEEVIFNDDPNFKAVVHKGSGGVLSMKKKPKGGLATMFGPVQDIQRGYGEYVVEGEEEELALGPVRHLIFVVHGIGEAMWSRADVSIPGIIQDIDKARIALHKRQVEAWKRECERAKKSKTSASPPPPPSRIELLPIEWYNKIHSSSSSLMKSLQSSTLRTIPALRAIANDVVFDVLMYLTPEFCEQVLDCVTDQINHLFTEFQTVHKNFATDGGKCSLIGHSLGSVIVWDLLSILKDNTEQKMQSDHTGSGTKDDPIIPSGLFCGIDVNARSGPASHPMGYQAYAGEDEHANMVKNGTWGPSLPKKMSKSIPFVPDFTVFLGSPLGLFLTLRGAHAVFDEMRIVSETTETETETETETKSELPSKNKNQSQASSPSSAALEAPMSSPFTLPAGAVYNIFHPSDPVAYRIEPLLLPQDIKEADIPPPMYLVKEGQGVRLHVKAMQLGDTMVKSFVSKSNSITGFFSKVAENASAAKAEGDDETAKERKGSSGSSPRGGGGAKRLGPNKFALGGRSSRIDFQLQPGIIDNEYLSAVSAHSSYFTNGDLLDFIIDTARIKSEVVEMV